MDSKIILYSLRLHYTLRYKRVYYIQLRRSRRYISFTMVIFIFYDLAVFQVTQTQYLCGNKNTLKNCAQQLCVLSKTLL